MFEKIIANLANHNPLFSFGFMILGVFIPKILEFMFKSKEARTAEKERSIERLSEQADDLFHKLEKLDKELDGWKDKYYDLQAESNNLKAFQMIATQKLEEAGISLDWPFKKG